MNTETDLIVTLTVTDPAVSSTGNVVLFASIRSGMRIEISSVITTYGTTDANVIYVTNFSLETLIESAYLNIKLFIIISFFEY